MNFYTAEDERRIRWQALVREWTKSGLLDAAQGEAFDAELRVNVRRTNNFLRAGLALFTALVVAASVALVGVLFDLDDEFALAVLAGGSAVGCLKLAQMLVVRQRFYRFGVEEALAVGSVFLTGIGTAAFVDALDLFDRSRPPLIAGLLASAAGFFGIYRRFGYVYAAIGTLACVAAVPFQLDVPPPVERSLAAATLLVGFVIARGLRSRADDEYPGDDYTLVQAAAWAGIYLTLNLELFPARIGGGFYWFTYLATWLLPIAGLFLGIRDRDRALLDVSLVTMLVTLLTNKSYLGWPRHEWDPIVLGVFLMAVGVGVRRWLAAGPSEQRGAFTAARILDRERGAVTVLGTVSARFHPHAPSMAEPTDDGFKGGRSGGGGATGSF